MLINSSFYQLFRRIIDFGSAIDEFTLKHLYASVGPSRYYVISLCKLPLIKKISISFISQWMFMMYKPCLCGLTPQRLCSLKRVESFSRWLTTPSLNHLEQCRKSMILYQFSWVCFTKWLFHQIMSGTWWLLTCFQWKRLVSLLISQKILRTILCLFPHKYLF